MILDYHGCSAQLIKHLIWDDLATSGRKHLFPTQSNFTEIRRNMEIDQTGYSLESDLKDATA